MFKLRQKKLLALLSILTLATVFFVFTHEEGIFMSRHKPDTIEEKQKNKPLYHKAVSTINSPQDQLPAPQTDPDLVSLSEESNYLLNSALKNPQQHGEFLDRVRAHIRRLCDTSQDEATSFVMKLPSGVIRNSTLGTLAYRLNIYPNDRLLKLLEHISEPTEIDAVMQGLYGQLNKESGRTGVLSSNSKAKLNWYIENAKDQTQLKAIYSQVAPALFKEGFENGKTWLLSLDDTVSKDADSYIIRNLGLENPELAISILQEFINQDKFTRFDSVSIQFIESYKNFDPIKCVDWVLLLPDDIPQKKKMINMSMTHLFMKDPAKAEEYLQKINDPVLRKLVADQNADQRNKNGFK